MRLRRKPKAKVAVRTEGLSPERIRELEAEAMRIRMEGRRLGDYGKWVGKQVLAHGRPWPEVITDAEAGTTAVPATYEGLLSLICSWDSLLLDEEIAELREVVAGLMPMGLHRQEIERRRQAAIREHEEHMREHHPEDWRASQGWMV